MALILPSRSFCAVLYALNRLYTKATRRHFGRRASAAGSGPGPVLLIAFATTIVAYMFNLYFMPAGMREMKDRVFEIRADLVNTFVREGAFTSPVEGLTVYVGERNGGEIRGILVPRRAQPKKRGDPTWPSAHARHHAARPAPDHGTTATSNGSRRRRPSQDF